MQRRRLSPGLCVCLSGPAPSLLFKPQASFYARVARIDSKSPPSLSLPRSPSLSLPLARSLARSLVVRPTASVHPRHDSDREGERERERERAKRDSPKRERGLQTIRDRGERRRRWRASGKGGRQTAYRPIHGTALSPFVRSSSSACPIRSAVVSNQERAGENAAAAADDDDDEAAADGGGGGVALLQLLLSSSLSPSLSPTTLL